MQKISILKGGVSGLLWAIIPLWFFRNELQAYKTVWILVCGCLTGTLLAVLMASRPHLLARQLIKALLTIPALMLAEAVFAFFLTLPATWEGSWPGRWIELTLGAFWVTFFSFLFVLLVPLSYLNITWITRDAQQGS